MGAHELIVEARTENLGAVLDFVAAKIADAPPKVQNHIAIAVEEIFVNIASYAYTTELGTAVISVVVLEDVTIAFEDAGVPYNPLTKEDPDITLSAEERKIGGLGIYMTKKLMDSVEYRREGNKNILTIKKTVGPCP